MGLFIKDSQKIRYYGWIGIIMATISTRYKLPWKLVYVEQQESKRSALIRERNLKKADRQRIEALLIHPKNIITEFLPEPDDSGG